MMLQAGRILVLALFMVTGQVLASGPEAAAAPAQSVEEMAAPCAACHGANGVSQNPMYPSLAGQYQDYLAASLKAYKTGERKNPVMAGMAAGLTAQDIQRLAAYFAAQKGSPLYTPVLK
jgi:cytochrome c553